MQAVIEIIREIISSPPAILVFTAILGVAIGVAMSLAASPVVGAVAGFSSLNSTSGLFFRLRDLFGNRSHNGLPPGRPGTGRHRVQRRL